MSAPSTGGLFSLASVADALAARLNSLGTLLDGAGQGLATLTTVMTRTVAAIVSVTPAVEVLKAAYNNVTTAVKAFTIGIVEALRQLGPLRASLLLLGIGVAAAGAAFAAITTAFMRMVPTMVGAVAQLAPGLTDVLSYSFRGLQATIGQAFVPVIQVFIGVINNIAGTLNPVMQRLAPLFGQLARAIGGILIAAVEALAAIIEGMMPVLQIIVGLFEVVAAVLRPFFLIIGALFKSLMAAFGFNVENAMKSFVDAAKWAGAQLLILAARIAAFLGAKDFVKALHDMLEKKPMGQAPALQGGAVTDFAALTHAMAAASVTAAGGLEEEKGPDYNKMAAETLQKILDTMKPWAEKSAKEKVMDLNEFGKLIMPLGHAAEGIARQLWGGGK